MMIVYYAAVVVQLICLVMVLLKLFPAEGPVKGVLGIICGLYTFIWGWMNASKYNLRNIMLIWTIAFIVCLALGFMGGVALIPRS